MNVGDPAGAEFDDILLGVDHCVDLGIAAPGRIGVTGASYGGYLTGWAVCTTDRFAAGVMVSGIVDNLSCHLTCNHAFAEFICGGDHRDPRSLELFVGRSPITRRRREDPHADPPRVRGSVHTARPGRGALSEPAS